MWFVVCFLLWSLDRGVCGLEEKHWGPGEGDGISIRERYPTQRGD